MQAYHSPNTSPLAAPADPEMLLVVYINMLWIDSSTLAALLENLARNVGAAISEPLRVSHRDEAGLTAERIVTALQPCEDVCGPGFFVTALNTKPCSSRLSRPDLLQ